MYIIIIIIIIVIIIIVVIVIIIIVISISISSSSIVVGVIEKSKTRSACYSTARWWTVSKKSEWVLKTVYQCI